MAGAGRFRPTRHRRRRRGRRGINSRAATEARRAGRQPDSRIPAPRRPRQSVRRTIARARHDARLGANRARRELRVSPGPTCNDGCGRRARGARMAVVGNRPRPGAVHHGTHRRRPGLLHWCLAGRTANWPMASTATTTHRNPRRNDCGQLRCCTNIASIAFGHAARAHGPKSQSVSAQPARPISGSTQRNVPAPPK